MSYEQILKNAPPHGSKDFLKYLKQTSVIVWENPDWLVVQNIKYHTPEKPWLTAFWKGDENGTCFTGEFSLPLQDLPSLYAKYGEWEWVKKASSKQTVPGRFHIHLKGV